MGCFVWGQVSLNILLMGFLALSFSQGPYSSFGQELWYRYGSIGFFIGGGLVPLLATIALRKKQHPAMEGALCLWLGVTLIAFLIYAATSGGGV